MANQKLSKLLQIFLTFICSLMILVMSQVANGEEQKITIRPVLNSITEDSTAASSEPTTKTAENIHLPISAIESLLHEPPLFWLSDMKLDPTMTSDEILATTESVNITTPTIMNEAETIPTNIFFSGAVRDGKIWINDASIRELMSALNLDYHRARNIYHYRRIYGPFKSHFELKQVHGINEITMNRLKKYIVIATPQL